jgi:hypothetical protein
MIEKARRRLYSCNDSSLGASRRQEKYGEQRERGSRDRSASSIENEDLTIDDRAISIPSATESIDIHHPS